MKHARGFTLIELLITTTVMVILLTLAVAGVRSSQVSARDTQRQINAETIARGFEQNYFMADTFGAYRIPGKTKGSYPGTHYYLHAGSWDMCTNYPANYIPCNSIPTRGYLTDFLPGVTAESLKSPFFRQAVNNDVALLSTWYYSNDAETRLNEIKAQVMTNDRYLYEPLNSDGSTCNIAGCRKFRLYYKDEANSWYKVIKSKNQ